MTYVHKPYVNVVAVEMKHGPMHLATIDCTEHMQSGGTKDAT